MCPPLVGKIIHDHTDVEPQRLVCKPQLSFVIGRHRCVAELWFETLRRLTLDGHHRSSVRAASWHLIDDHASATARRLNGMPLQRGHSAQRPQPARQRRAAQRFREKEVAEHRGAVDTLVVRLRIARMPQQSAVARLVGELLAAQSFEHGQALLRPACAAVGIRVQATQFEQG